jgi:hypothetical protein
LGKAAGTYPQFNEGALLQSVLSYTPQDIVLYLMACSKRISADL